MSDVHVARYEVMDVLDNARVEKTSEKVWYTVWYRRGSVGASHGSLHRCAGEKTDRA
jgi:hypothetical protein